MPHFPGIAMIIDDQFHLIHTEIDNDPNLQVQKDSLIVLKDFLEDNTIPYVVLGKTDDYELLESKIKGYDNVRLLILDLDLNDDGNVGEEDDIPLIKKILSDSLEKYGYFFLIINSAHSEAWDNIKNNLEENINVFSKPNSAVSTYNKNDNKFADLLIELQTKNFSLELIYDFESALNAARDQAFQGIIDNEKRTWNKIYKQLVNETTTQASFILSTSYLSIIRQYMLNAVYSNPVNIDPIDDEIAKKAFGLVNYINNINGNLNNHPIWTGNLYKLNSPIYDNLEYALIITPECDIAQNKVFNYQVVFGYEINQNTFPEDYDPINFVELQPPLHAFKAGKTKAKWRDKANLRDFKGLIEHLYILPFVSDTNKTIVLDFRDITFISKNAIENADEWKLIKRINDPMITDILDKISGIFNRKGILPLLPDKIKPY